MDKTQSVTQKECSDRRDNIRADVSTICRDVKDIKFALIGEGLSGGGLVNTINGLQEKMVSMESEFSGEIEDIQQKLDGGALMSSESDRKLLVRLASSAGLGGVLSLALYKALEIIYVLLT